MSRQPPKLDPCCHSGKSSLRLKHVASHRTSQVMRNSNEIDLMHISYTPKRLQSSQSSAMRYRKPPKWSLPRHVNHENGHHHHVKQYCSSDVWLKRPTPLDLGVVWRSGSLCAQCTFIASDRNVDLPSLQHQLRKVPSLRFRSSVLFNRTVPVVDCWPWGFGWAPEYTRILFMRRGLDYLPR